MNNKFQQEFIKASIYRINESAKRVTKCLDEIDEIELWKKPNEHSNSIGNIVLHLCGNIRQYIISSLGQVEDIRERDKEFSASGVFKKSELLAKLQQTINEAITVMEDLDELALAKLYLVQGFQLSGVGIIIHVTEHFSYHTGQIAFWVKLLKNTDLGFYQNINLNVKNKN
ncbi:MAG: DinB family protein [Ginsengibacter sp.]